MYTGCGMGMGCMVLWGMCCGDGSGRVWDGVRMGFVVLGGNGVREGLGVGQEGFCGMGW